LKNRTKTPRPIRTPPLGGKIDWTASTHRKNSGMNARYRK
jgi:hypothetical protein